MILRANKILKSIFLSPRQARLVPFVVALFCLIFLPNLVESQEANYQPYNHKPQGAEQPTTKAEQIVTKNVRRAYDALNDYVDEHGKKIAKYAANQKEKETRFGHQGPERHPLDKLNGRLDPARSWNEYVMDSRIILSPITFPQCMEPRVLAERKNDHVTITDPANALYAGICAFNCPKYFPFWPIRVNRNWQVVSYYWPEHQISVNKAGAQMIDPDIVNENRGQQELYRIPTSQKEENDNERGMQAQLRLLEKMGIPATDSEKFKNPDYHHAGRELHLRQDGVIRYPGVMRPNAFWRAANSRRAQRSGYKRNKECLFNALDQTTAEKKIVGNRYDQGIYAILARYPEIRRRTDQERYRYTSPSKLNIKEYRNGDKDMQYAQSLCASWRMGSNPEVYGQLRDVGFQQVSDNKYKKYCLPGGYDLSGSMEHPSSTPRLQADAARAVMAAIWFGSTSGSLNSINGGGKRISKFTLYKKYENSSVNRYVNNESNPGENKSKIVFIDKMQRIYPTQQISGKSDGKMGASSKSFRVDTGQRGSQCFRPEDIPNWSSEGSTNKSEWPLGVMGSVEDHFGETRWAVWNRRILCSCEDVGLLAGCLNMNDGDHDESVFAGTLGYTGRSMPPAFEKALPSVRGLANKKDAPSRVSKGFNGIDLNSVTADSKIAGFTYALMPGGSSNPPQVNQAPDPSKYVICMAPQDQRPRGGNNQNGGGCAGGNCPSGGGGQPGGGAGSGGFNGGIGGGNSGGIGGGIGGGACANGQCGIGGGSAATGSGGGVDFKPFNPKPYRSCLGDYCIDQPATYTLRKVNTDTALASDSVISNLVCSGEDCYEKAVEQLSRVSRGETIPSIFGGGGGCPNGQCGVGSGGGVASGGVAPGNSNSGSGFSSGGGCPNGQCGVGGGSQGGGQQGQNGGQQYCVPVNGQQGGGGCSSGSCSGGGSGAGSGGGGACSGGSCGGGGSGGGAGGGGCSGGSCGSGGGGSAGGGAGGGAGGILGGGGLGGLGGLGGGGLGGLGGGLGGLGGGLGGINLPGGTHSGSDNGSSDNSEQVPSVPENQGNTGTNQDVNPDIGSGSGNPVPGIENNIPSVSTPSNTHNNDQQVTQGSEDTNNTAQPKPSAVHPFSAPQQDQESVGNLFN